MSMRVLAAGLLGVSILLGGCGESGTDVDRPPLTGTWSGAWESDPGYVVDITLTLVEASEEAIQGTGTLITPQPETVGISVLRGVYLFPQFGLVLAVGSDDPTAFEGSITSDGSQLRGTLVGRPLILNRSGS